MYVSVYHAYKAKIEDFVILQFKAKFVCDYYPLYSKHPSYNFCFFRENPENVIRHFRLHRYI